MNNVNMQTENSNSFPVWLIILIIVGVSLLFYAAYTRLSIEKFQLLADTFNKVSLGLAALLAVFVGQKWVGRQEEKERKIKEYLSKYPHDKFQKEWIIVEPASMPGTFYLFEKKSGVVHHILNMKTVYDLGWHVYLPTSKKIKDEIFRSHAVGDKIRTQGEAGE